MTDRLQGLFALDVSQYQPHPLHSCDRDWRESNCYADLWVAVLHGLGLEVHASLAYCLDVGFEGDQFTFYKPSLSELEDLYGIRVDELCLWGPLLDQCALQIARQRMPIVEVDAYHLPDTRGTDYRTNHVKTTVGMVGIDAAAKRLTYFHNAGLFSLEGEDFERVFAPTLMPPYTEMAGFERLVHRSPASLREIARVQAAKHLARVPRQNPLAAYARIVDAQIESCIGQDEETFHRYIFASVRQLGSSADFSMRFLRWLDADADASGLAEAIAGFDQISTTCKMLILKTSRMARRKQATSVQGYVEEMAGHWQQAMDGLAKELRRGT